MNAAERKAKRATWTTRIVRSQEEADALDVSFWLAIPEADRARVTWELSEELHRIAHPDEPYEPRLSRSVTRVTRG